MRNVARFILLGIFATCLGAIAYAAQTPRQTVIQMEALRVSYSGEPAPAPAKPGKPLKKKGK